MLLLLPTPPFGDKPRDWLDPVFFFTIHLRVPRRTERSVTSLIGSSEAKRLLFLVRDEIPGSSILPNHDGHKSSTSTTLGGSSKTRRTHPSCHPSLSPALPVPPRSRHLPTMRGSEDGNVSANEHVGYVGWGAEGASAENENLASSWRRRSVDASIQRTAAIAAARDAPKMEPVPPVLSGNSTVDKSPSSTTFNPPLQVQVENLSLWVRPAFPKPNAFPKKAPPVAKSATQTPQQLGDIATVDIEKAERTVKGCFLSSTTGEKEVDAKNLESKKTQNMVRVLNSVSFTANPGELLAVLGPSGSGKTSLVTAVAGRINTKSGAYVLEGSTRFTETSPSKTSNEISSGTIKRRVGFVTQDDCMFPSLTVSETIQYAAALRLPDESNNAVESRTIKRNAAESVIQTLNLESCVNTPIGGVFSFPGRGISGGERRRVSIAVELLTKPSVLLLDEPTSGLDSTVANTLVKTLSGLAKGVDGDALSQRTVVMTIHQPSSRVVTEFDVTLFLAKGQKAYYGSVKGINAYFVEGIGVVMPFGCNPADFALDVCNGEVDGYEALRGKSQASSSVDPDLASKSAIVETVLAASSRHPSRVGDDGEEVSEFVAVALDADASDNTGKSPVTPGNTPGTTCATSDQDSVKRFATSWLSQTAVLLKRALTARREGFFDKLKIGQILVVAFLVGLLWFDRGNTVGINSVGDISGVLFFELLFISFLTLFSSLFTFPDEKAVALKERQSGVIRVSSYFVARTLADVPVDLFSPTLFVPIVYWMAGLRGSPVAFITHLLVVYLITLVSSSLGLFIGCIAPNQKQAQTFASVIMLAVMLTGGFYFDKTPTWLDWTKETSFVNHAYAALLKIQFPNGGEFPCFQGEREALLSGTSGATSEAVPIGLDGAVETSKTVSCYVSDTQQLSFVDLSESVGVNVGSLACIFVGLRAATYLALRFVTLTSR